MPYVVVASKQTDRRGISAPSATEALRIVDGLIRARFDVEHILDEGSHEVSVARLQQLAERERSEAPPRGFDTPAS